MKEPIRHLYEKEGFNPGKIEKYVIGEKYVGVMLKNGHIGVCATLDRQVEEDLFLGSEPDTDNPSHRIILNAWFNALCNYRRSYYNENDIFDQTDFSRFGRIVMVGYFESLYEKFRSASIEVKVFDIQKESSILTSPSLLNESLGLADVVILTGTTIFNNSFMDIVAATGNETSVYLLGPSNPLTGDMFGYHNVRLVFGSVFEPFDTGLFDKIKAGHGTRGFLDHLRKVYINSEDF